jgi:hypothetical protein
LAFAQKWLQSIGNEAGSKEIAKRMNDIFLKETELLEVRERERERESKEDTNKGTL